MEPVVRWKIHDFETSAGEKPVRQFTSKQRPQAIAKITRLTDLLEQYGPLLSMPFSKKLADNLYELRVRGKEEIRVIYAFKNQTIYLLHAFKKQTKKTPHKELELAATRFRSLDIV